MKQGYNYNECRYSKKHNSNTNKLSESRLDFKNKKIIKIIFNGSHGLNLAARHILKKYKLCNQNAILINKNNKKLREILLTKRKLHNKIGKMIQ